jgi:predicted dehydrogenase
MHEVSERKKLAIVGCGAITREHLKVSRMMDSMDLVALCDVDKDALARMSMEGGVARTYTDFSKMLETEDLSIVSILTPPQFHAPMAVAAIEKGINVLLEKPLTITSGEAELILKALQKTGVKLTVDYNALFSQVMIKAMDLVRQAAIGEVLGMEVRMLQTKDDAMAVNQKHWCHKIPGGRFGEMLAHPVYLLQAILGDTLESATVLAQKRGAYDWMRYDELCVLLSGRKGIGRIYASFNAPRLTYQVDIFGTQKILSIDLLNQTLVILGYRTSSRTDSAKDCFDISRQLIFQTIKNTFFFLRRERGQDALRRVYTSLLDGIDARRELVVSPDMAYHTVKIVEEICRAM